jgi:hypothetical protein
MRYMVLTLLAFGLAAGSARLQEIGLATENARPEEGWAEKMFKEGLTHDFGTVPRGAQLLHKFNMTNIFATPLQISLTIHCGCVTATPSVRTLQPRQNGSVDIVMDASRFSGPKSVAVDVTVANGTEYASTARLNISATSRMDVVLNPGQIRFGVVPFGQRTPPQILDVDYAGALAWQITELDKQNAPVDATYKELFRRPGRVSYRVQAFLRPDAPAGPFKHEIYLKTNDPSCPLVPILVEGNVQATLTVVPNPLNLGNLKLGEDVTKMLVVKASKPFRLVSFDGLGDGVTVVSVDGKGAVLPSKEDKVHVIKAKYQPDKAGTIHKQLSIKTDLDKESQITVTLEGAAEQ